MFNFKEFILGMLTVLLVAQVVHMYGYITYYNAGKKARKKYLTNFFCASMYEARLSSNSPCTNRERAFARGVLGRSINILEVLTWWK